MPIARPFRIWTRTPGGLASLTVPAALFAVGWALAFAAGLRPRIDWNLWQLLDRAALERDPLHALWLLHAQPPGWNALAALVLAAARATGGAVETIAGAVLLAFALAAVVLVHRLVDDLAGPTPALIATLALVANPGFWLFANDFFYALPLAAGVAALLLALHRYLIGGAFGFLVVAAAAALALGATSTLFAPLLLLLLLGLAVVWRSRTAPRGTPGRATLRASLAMLGGLALLFTLWPTKNELLFGRFTYSSWFGYNLSNMSGVRSLSLARFLEAGDPTPAAVAWWRAHAQSDIVEDPVVAAPTKAGGGRNWNHFVFLFSTAPLESASFDWMASHPGEWVRRAVSNYARWTRPIDVHPYKGDRLGPDTPLFRGWARAFDLLSPDLRAPVEAATPESAVHVLARDESGRPIPYTLFGVVALPAIFVAAAWRWAARRKALGASEGTVAGAALLLLWTLVIPCLTDGSEGNRMRLAAAPALAVVAAFAAGAIRRGESSA